MIKKLLKNTLFFGLAPYVPKIVSVFLLPIMTKYLTATDYGIAGTIDAYTQALTAFSTLGFTTVLSVIFFRAKQQYKILWREIYGFLQYWMIIFAIIQATLLYFVIPKEAEEYKWWIILFTNFSNVFFGPTAVLGNLYYVSSMKPLPVVSRSIIGGITTILANYILVVHYRLGYFGWYVGGFIGTFLINASYWYTVNIQLNLKPIFNFKRKTILKYLKIALPTIPHYYCVYMMNTSSKVIMNIQSIPLNIIGQTNLVLQIGVIIESWINAMNQAINPMAMNEIRNKNEDKAKTLIFLYYIITLSCTFLFSLWCKEIFHILISNEELAETYPYAIVFVMALNYRPPYVAASNMFFFHENTSSLMKISFIAGLIAVISYIILIPLFGVWGVVVGFYISSFYMGYSGFLMKQFKSKTKVDYPYLRLLSTHLIATILVLKLVNLDIHWKLFTCFLLLFSFIIILKCKKNQHHEVYTKIFNK